MSLERCPDCGQPSCADAQLAEEDLQEREHQPLRVAVRKFLNKDGHNGAAHIIAKVSNTSKITEDDFARSHIRLKLADCSRSVSFDFGMWSEEEIDNSLHKARILAETMAKFMMAIEEEAELAKTRMKAAEKARSADAAREPEMVTPVARVMRD